MPPRRDSTRYGIDDVALEAAAIERLAGARDWLDSVLAVGDVPTGRAVSICAWSIMRAQHLLEISRDVREARGDTI